MRAIVIIIVVVIVVFISIWLITHFTAAPGARISILWGVVQYDKQTTTQSDLVQLPSTLLEEFEPLKELDSEQLHLFLIIGGPTGDEVTYIDKTPAYRAERNYRELDARGLIQYEGQDDKGRHRFRTTEKGRTLHNALMRILQNSLGGYNQN